MKETKLNCATITKKFLFPINREHNNNNKKKNLDCEEEK